MKIKRKLGIILILAILMASLPAMNISAVAPEWFYQCAKSVLDVNIDGKVGDAEWDDAIELIVNNDSEIFKKYGYWQGGEDHPIPSSDLSVSYKLKWDEKYLYILEVRYDKHFSFNADAGVWPWEASGTLLFLAYDAADFNEPSDGAYEIFWVINPNGAPKLSGRATPGKTGFEEGSPEMEGWVVANTASGDTYTIELAIPWATMQKVADYPAPAEGVKLRFTPIISAYLTKVTESVYDENWNQLDFYVNTSAADDITGEGALELVGVVYTPPAPAPEPEPENAAGGGSDAPDQPVVTAPAPTAPKTGDAGMMIFVFMILAAGAFAASKRAAKTR